MGEIRKVITNSIKKFGNIMAAILSHQHGLDMDEARHQIQHFMSFYYDYETGYTFHSRFSEKFNRSLATGRKKRGVEGVEERHGLSVFTQPPPFFNFYFYIRVGNAT